MVCLVYAFASDLLAAPWDLWVLYGAYMLDHILFALRVARTTYLKKIAVDPADITPTISLGITIDHVVAMSLPVLSGIIWERYGHQWVFLLAGGHRRGRVLHLPADPYPGPGGVTAMIDWIEIIGYAGSLLVAVSLMMSSLVRLRWINLGGALAFAVYGWLVGAYPVLAVNGFIVLVNVYYLWRMNRSGTISP